MPAIKEVNWEATNTLSGRALFIAFFRSNVKHNEAFVTSWLNIEFERIHAKMARKSGGSQQTPTRGSDGWIGFANIEVEPAHRDALQQGVYSLEDAFEVFGEMLAHGHKISVSSNKDTGSITVAATGISDACPNRGYTLSAFASDITRAIIVLAYKHEVIAKGKWSSVAKTRSEGDWG